MRGVFVALLALGLAACGHSHRPSCDSTSRDLADDELLPDLDYTVSDLLASLAGERVVPAQLLGDGRVQTGVSAVAVTLTRGEGTARWTDSVPVDLVTTHFGFGDDYLLMAVICDSGVNVPAHVSVARQDGSGSVEGDGPLAARVDDLVNEQVSVAATTASGDGDWSEVRSAYAGYTEGLLTGVQLQTRDDIVVDWR